MKKILLLLLAIILLGGSVGSVFLVINCIDLVEYYNVEYNDLHYNVFTYEEYIKKSGYKSGGDYEIYVSELDDPLHISSITQKEFNKEYLSTLENGDLISIYYRESSSSKYVYDICEMKSDDVIFLKLEDYRAVNANNQKVGVGMCIFLALDLLFLSFLCFYFFIKVEKSIRK